MLNKIRYHHEQQNLHANNESIPHNGSFSVMLIPVDQEFVEIRHTFCSKKDMFSRRAAREALQKKEGSIIPVSLLPNAFAEIRLQSTGDEDVVFTMPEVRRGLANQYAWVWKYFL